MSKQNKIINFLKKNGFYLCLAVCVLGVGLAVFFGTAGNGKTEEEIPEQQVQAIRSPSVKPVAKPSASASPSPSSTPSPTVSAQPETSGQTGKSGGGKAGVTLKMPLNGEVTSAFSGETLVFNQTLNMWMTHNGVDITSAATDEVVCALAGEVASVFSDETRGMVVEISHANNTKTVYAGLSEVGVSEGSLVNAGTPIGKAGTPGFEAASGKHLHFEYIVDGKFKDPAKYFVKG